MNYLYRVLNVRDFESVNNNEGIIAKNKVSDDTSLKDVFKTINSHLLYGNKKESCWISCSSSFEKVIIRYNTARQGFNNKRQPLAVIKESKQTKIITPSGLNIFDKGISAVRDNIGVVLDSKVGEVKKIQIDVSNRAEAKQLGNIGIILNKEGNCCRNNVLSLGYSVDNREILFLNEIKKEEIAGILYPMEIDLLYFLGETNFEQNLNTLLTLRPSFDFNQLTPAEQELFQNLYVENSHLNEVVEQIWSSNKDVDLLTLYNTFRELKRSLLTKILSFYNLTLTLSKVVEDNLLVVRCTKQKARTTGKIIYGKSAIELLTVKQSNLDLAENKTKFITLVVIDEGLSFDFDDTNWLKGDTSFKNQLSDKMIDSLNEFAHINEKANQRILKTNV